MKKEKKGEGKVRVIIMMVMMMVMMGCNSGGGIKEGEEGKGRKGDGSVIDLKGVSNKIKDAVEFAQGVKEVHTLVKSIDELAKAIGKKIKNDGGLDTEAGKNGTLVAGVFSVALDVQTKLVALEAKTSDNELKKQIVDVKTKGNAFIDKMKSKHNDLGKQDSAVTDNDAKAAIDRSNSGDKGATELSALNVSIDGLLKTVNEVLKTVISELLTSDKKS
ncbi:Variable outer membrane protein [Borrelia duttonii CR2A]|uniref:Variable outer membrane protein n=1 Tax=Borrelia duttonii CR2A TaxID=1432657 RepID=W6TFY7_9SPIR|nr:Vsp/OspC family lipoprotein [Borrelia duttonii]ETZ17275.1 Variable outer membrane protein [Borrelia duttonii CR2A]